MYGSSGGSSSYLGLGGSGLSGNSNPTVLKGANISLEALNEWKIQEIGYDGVEKYIRPESLSDHVGKLARKVNWRKLVGSDAVYDNPSTLPEESDDEPADDENKEKDDLKEKKKEVPEAGPWHSVAKNLHESLAQINILLDNLSVINHTDYCKPLTIVDPSLHEHYAGSQDVIANSKANQWVWKRKALAEAYNILDVAVRQRPTEGIDDEFKIKSQFFTELKQMREYWRVRKTGDHIYGDLGYKIFGTKYDSRELYDISRRSVPLMPDVHNGNNYSVLQVTVPCDLTRRSTLSVSVVKDDIATKNLFGEDADSELEYMKVDKKQVENVYWKNALRWAQETLICRDTFNQLASDAVQLRSRLATIRDGVLLVSLFDDWLLKIQLKYHPFTPGEIPEEGDPYLNRTLRQMVVAQQCQRHLRPQLFVDCPLTSLPDLLDSRGLQSFTQAEIEDRVEKPRLLLEKLLSVASHFALVKMTVNALKEHMTDTYDPQMMWRWLRCSPTNSQITVHMTHRNFDFVVGKQTFYIRVNEDEVVVSSKEGHLIQCLRDPTLLKNAFKFMNTHFLVNSVAVLGKTWWSYQVLHANMNAMDAGGNISPTLYMCNSMSTWSILLQFRSEGDPTISIRNIAKQERHDSDPPFIFLKYQNLPGSSICKKMDNMFAMFRE